MDTYFIRHTESISIDEKTRQRIWNERRIAIHFPRDRAGKMRSRDNASCDPADYSPKKGRKQMRALTQLGSAGGYVCAEHHGHERCMVGLVKPQSKIKLIRGHWGIRSDYPGRVAIMKTLKLRKVKLVRPTESAAFLAGRPRMGTISPWYSVGKLIETIVKREKIKPSLGLLLPPQQEAMCGEFLRSRESTSLGLPRLSHLLLPVGGTLRDIDICGIDEHGNTIFAQVAYDKFEDCGEKVKSLHKYQESSRNKSRNKLILFCDYPKLERKDGVMVVPLREVYVKFTATEMGRLWLKHILRVVNS